MHQSDSVFAKISTRNEKQRAFGLLIERNIEVQCRFDDKILHKFTPSRLQDAILIMKSTHKEIPATVAVVTFSVGLEQYFLKSKIVSQGNGYAHLDLTGDLFKFQRRENYRLNFPPGYVAHFDIIQVENEKWSDNFVVINVSGGGLAFEVGPGKSLPVKVGNTIKGKLFISDRLDRNIVGVVRHVKSFGSAGSGLIRIGLEYQGFSSSEKEMMIQVVMDIHRDIFGQMKPNR